MVGAPVSAPSFVSPPPTDAVATLTDEFRSLSVKLDRLTERLDALERRKR